MAPAIVEHSNGALYLSLGGSGGSRIFGAIAQTILNVDRGMDISRAVEEPRVHDQLFPSLVSVESEFGEKVLEGLKEKGHNITGEFCWCIRTGAWQHTNMWGDIVFDINLGVAEIQAVSLDVEGNMSGKHLLLAYVGLGQLIKLSAASDSRKNGVAAGW